MPQPELAVTTPQLKSRLPQVGTTIFTLMSALAQKHGAVNLGQGFPDFDCDPRLLDAVNDAMRSGLNQYPPMAGVRGCARPSPQVGPVCTPLRRRHRGHHHRGCHPGHPDRGAVLRAPRRRGHRARALLRQLRT
jgi:hypothetical protein